MSITVGSYAVGVLHFSRGGNLARIAGQLASWSCPPLELIVVSNSYFDGVGPDDIEPGIPLTLHYLEGNPGYGAAVNFMMETVGKRVDALLVLTDDVDIAESTATSLVKRVVSEHEVAAAGPLIINKETLKLFSAGGRLSIRGQTSHLASIRGASRAKGWSSVDWVDGACICIKTACWSVVGDIDERFFMYVEEVEWALRAKIKGLRIEIARNLTASQTPGNYSPYLRFRNHLILNRLHRPSLRWWPWPVEILRVVLQVAQSRDLRRISDAFSGIVSGHKTTLLPRGKEWAHSEKRSH